MEINRDDNGSRPEGSVPSNGSGIFIFSNFINFDFDLTFIISLKKYKFKKGNEEMRALKDFKALITEKTGIYLTKHF